MRVTPLDQVETVDLDGHWDVVARPLARRDDMFTFVVDMAEGGGAEEHVHADMDHVFLVLTGQLHVTDGRDREVTVTAGQRLDVAAGVPHATVNPGPGPTRYVVLTYRVDQGHTD